jgi:hypothetical protein
VSTPCKYPDYLSSAPVVKGSPPRPPPRPVQRQLAAVRPALRVVCCALSVARCLLRVAPLHVARYCHSDPLSIREMLPDPSLALALLQASPHARAAVCCGGCMLCRTRRIAAFGRCRQSRRTRAFRSGLVRPEGFSGVLSGTAPLLWVQRGNEGCRPGVLLASEVVRDFGAAKTLPRGDRAACNMQHATYTLRAACSGAASAAQLQRDIALTRYARMALGLLARAALRGIRRSRRGVCSTLSARRRPPARHRRRRPRSPS